MRFASVIADEVGVDVRLLQWHAPFVFEVNTDHIILEHEPAIPPDPVKGALHTAVELSDAAGDIMFEMFME